MKKTLFMGLAVLFLSLSVGPRQLPTLAQENQDALVSKVDKLFADVDKPESPGAAIAVIKNGAVVYKRGYGIANLEYSVPITPSTVFHVASVSKQFTAFAVTLLANQGKLSLDDDIRKYLPEVPDFGKKITIRHLIHHTSGLRDQWELLAMGGWRLDDVITKEHILKMVRNQKELNFEPGQEHLYSNTGYTLLAVIVERVSGQSFPEFTAANIFKPLGMTNTHFHDDHQMIVKNRAYSYSPSTPGFRLAALNYANVGATSLFTTVEDLAKWVVNFEDKKIGGAPVIDQMQQKGILNNGTQLDYAFGLSIGPYRGLSTVGHSGGDAGYRSFVFWFPEQRFGVVVLSNLGSFNPNRVARQIADIYLADKLSPEAATPKPVEPVAAKVNPAIFDAYAGKYLMLDSWSMVSITKEGDKLFGQPDGEGKAELIPLSETKFAVKDIGGEVTFERDESGKVARFKLERLGQNRTANRTEITPATPAQLAEFAGDYYSAELGTTYTLVIKEGQLIAQHRRHDDIRLNQFEGDRFRGSQWFFQRVQFTRDADKHVVGFRLTGGRVRNVRFDKHPK
jgi:CubicO group peptidase (beta-lactamase class C family)